MIVGGEKEISRVRDEPLLRDRFRQGILFLDNYDKILFGTDWPLAAMKPYIDFCKTLVPEGFHEKYFRENAAKVYGIAATAC